MMVTKVVKLGEWNLDCDKHEACLVEVVEVYNPSKVVLPDQLRVQLLLVQQRNPKYWHLVPDCLLGEK